MAEPSQLYEETCKMIRSVLLPNKSGLFLCNLEREYRGMLGESIQWRRLGFHSLKDMIMNIPHAVNFSKFGDGQLLLHATPDSSTQHIANMVSKQRDSVSGYNVNNTRKLQNYKVRPQSITHSHLQSINTSPTLPPQLTQDLFSLLSAFPQGLLASDLLREYRKFYGRELNLSGFSSITELCSHLPNVVYLQKSGPDWLLLPAQPKVSRKIAELNDETEIEILLEKFKSLVMKRLQHSGKESGRLLKMLRECCKYLEDEGYWNLELIGDHQDHLEIGGDQMQYKGVGIDRQKLLEEFRDQRQRLEAERYSQQLFKAGGRQQYLEAGGNDHHIWEREIYEIRDVNYEKEEEDDHQVEAVREEGSSSVEAVICVERMSVKIDADTEVILHCIQFTGDTSTIWCSSQEIAHLIPVWGGRDLLAKMLVVKRVVMEHKILDTNFDGETLRELVKYGVKGVSGVNEVSLYKVKDINYFISLFNNVG